MTLDEFFKSHPKVALAFSGGVDSSYLLYAAVHAGADVQPYFVKGQFQPTFEMEDAMRLAGELGVSLKIMHVDALSSPTVVANPADRCYYCKQVVFNTLWNAARADGYEILMDGTNASDDAGDRPGMKALAELGVTSPLKDAGLVKSEIRRLSREAGLFTWDKPSYACLATRVATGDPLSNDLLSRIEAAEGHLFALGFTDFRVRIFHGAARLQVPAAQWEKAMEMREDVRAALLPYFPVVLIDTMTR